MNVGIPSLTLHQNEEIFANFRNYLKHDIVYSLNVTLYFGWKCCIMFHLRNYPYQFNACWVLSGFLPWYKCYIVNSKVVLLSSITLASQRKTYRFWVVMDMGCVWSPQRIKNLDVFFNFAQLIDWHVILLIFYWCIITVVCFKVL